MNFKVIDNLSMTWKNLWNTSFIKRIVLDPTPVSATISSVPTWHNSFIFQFHCNYHKSRTVIAILSLVKMRITGHPSLPTIITIFIICILNFFFSLSCILNFYWCISVYVQFNTVCHKILRFLFTCIIVNFQPSKIENSLN